MESNVDAKHRNARRHRRIVYFLLDLLADWFRERRSRREATRLYRESYASEGRSYAKIYVIIFQQTPANVA